MDKEAIETEKNIRKIVEDIINDKPQRPEYENEDVFIGATIAHETLVKILQRLVVVRSNGLDPERTPD